jgi:hypothetical protein
MVKRNKALRSPDCFLGADIGAAAAVGAKIGDNQIFTFSIFYDGLHGAFFDTDGTTGTFFPIDNISHGRVGPICNLWEEF